ncbi:MAG TPA: carboxypeptidase-like regulatory domain-containing protein [Pyrinomonadaceae bacterium]|nr:carboxypeptidase-like regulatory domain-containing protein [Pyrinomonadaceae bacterium]
MNHLQTIKGVGLIGVLLCATSYIWGQEIKSDDDLGSTSAITIIQQASPESANPFTFSTTGTGLSNFTLFDDGVDNDATPNNRTFSNLLVPGQSASFSVTQTGNGIYDLTNISCSVQGTGGSSTSPNIPAQTVNITLFFGDLVTCTFFDSIITAANVSISGRVITEDGRPISNALISVTEVATGDVFSARSTAFGFYKVDGMSAGNLYFVTVIHRRYGFESHLLSMQDSLEEFDLIGF